jgi:hypothetical protein
MPSKAEAVVSAARPRFYDFYLLPANAGNTKAHILGRFSSSDLNLAWEDSQYLWDYIATAFCGLKNHEKAILDFFNPKKESFKFTTGQLQDQNQLTLIIWRVSTDVLVSPG